MTDKRKLPELLSPAGTMEALDAALAAGADAVYFGGEAFHARAFAGNFSPEALGKAICKCAFWGVKSNITVNTLLFDREEAELLRYVEKLYRLGVDALIVTDLGAAEKIHAAFPDLALHASTQLSGHNVRAAAFLQALGFSRMVCARELPRQELQFLCANAPIETELFIHGAMCVSQSGQCLMSSMIGGRSGNRGECAQPCRMMWQMAGKTGYPLSLKDMCLAAHIPEIIRFGAASLKIEGRMKGPAYVFGITSLYRHLLDEGRCATAEEMVEAQNLFCRSGLTDGYFTRKISLSMNGVRTQNDKQNTVSAQKAIQPKLHEAQKAGVGIPLTLHVTAQAGQPLSVSFTADGITITRVSADCVQMADGKALTEEVLRRNLTKLGNTPFVSSTVELSLQPGVWIALCAVNALRRAGTEQLEALVRAKRDPRRNLPCAPQQIAASSLVSALHKASEQPVRDGVFLFLEQIPRMAVTFFRHIYLPLEVFAQNPDAAIVRGVDGVLMPPVIFDSQEESIQTMLSLLQKKKIHHALISNIAQLSLCREYGYFCHGSLRLNITNRGSASFWETKGLMDSVLSPELTLPQIRDILPLAPEKKGVVVYGDLPLMTLEKCVIRPTGEPKESCHICDHQHHLFFRMTDRTGAAFGAVKTFGHRNILFNSLPVYMLDRQALLCDAGVGIQQFLFTGESMAECETLLQSAIHFTPPSTPVRRIK